MSEFTTIKLKRETKEKLDLIKKDNRVSYNDIICNLIRQTGGTYVEDTVSFARDKVAYTLKCWKTDNPEDYKIFEITYQDLKESEVGTVFNPCPVGISVDFVSSTSEVIFKQGDDVILLNKYFYYDSDGKCDVDSRVVHFNVF